MKELGITKGEWEAKDYYGDVMIFAGDDVIADMGAEGKAEDAILICDAGNTALISEHYYPKEFVEWLLKQDSYPQDNGGTYFLVNGVAGDDAILLFYHWNKYIKKENEQ